MSVLFRPMKLRGAELFPSSPSVYGGGVRPKRDFLEDIWASSIISAEGQFEPNHLLLLLHPPEELIKVFWPKLDHWQLNTACVRFTTWRMRTLSCSPVGERPSGRGSERARFYTLGPSIKLRAVDDAPARRRRGASVAARLFRLRTPRGTTNVLISLY